MSWVPILFIYFILLTPFVCYCSQLENSTVQVSEQGTRKQLYQRIVATFPEGWMTSGQISREGKLLCPSFFFPDLGIFY